MQLPEYLEAEMKSFYKKNKKSSNNMAAIKIKPSPRLSKERLADDAQFIRDLSYEFAYGKSYEEIYDIVYNEAKEKMASEQDKALAQAKALSIATMFRKTGWDAEKIADISGFPLDLVKEVINKLKD